MKGHRLRKVCPVGQYHALYMALMCATTISCVAKVTVADTLLAIAAPDSPISLLQTRNQPSSKWIGIATT